MANKNQLTVTLHADTEEGIKNLREFQEEYAAVGVSVKQTTAAIEAVSAQGAASRAANAVTTAIQEIIDSEKQLLEYQATLEAEFGDKDVFSAITLAIEDLREKAAELQKWLEKDGTFSRLLSGFDDTVDDVKELLKAPADALFTFMDETLDYFDENKDAWGNWNLNVRDSISEFTGYTELGTEATDEMVAKMKSGLEDVSAYFSEGLLEGIVEVDKALKEGADTIKETGSLSEGLLHVQEAAVNVWEKMVVTIGAETKNIDENTKSKHEGKKASEYLTEAEEKRFETEKKWLSAQDAKQKALGHELTLWERLKVFYNNPLDIPGGEVGTKHGIDIDALMAYKDGLQEINGKLAPAAGQATQKLLDLAVKFQLTTEQTAEVYSKLSVAMGGDKWAKLPAVKDEGSSSILDPITSMLGLGGAKAPSGSMDKDVVGQLLHIKQTAHDTFTSFAMDIINEGRKAGTSWKEIMSDLKHMAEDSGNYMKRSFSGAVDTVAQQAFLDDMVAKKKSINVIAETFEGVFKIKMPAAMKDYLVKTTDMTYGNLDSLIKGLANYLRDHPIITKEDQAAFDKQVNNLGIPKPEVMARIADYNKRTAELARKAQEELSNALSVMREKHSETIKDINKDITDYSQAWKTAQAVFGNSSEEATTAFEKYADKVHSSSQQMLALYEADMSKLSSLKAKALSLENPQERDSQVKSIESSMKALNQASVQAFEGQRDSVKAVLTQITTEYEQQAEKWADIYKRYAQMQQQLDDQIHEARKAIQEKGTNSYQKFVNTTTDMLKRQEEAEKLKNEGTEEGLKRAQKLWNENIQAAKGLGEVYVSNYDLMTTAQKHQVDKELEYYSEHKDLTQQDYDRQQALLKLKKDKTVLISEEYAKQVGLGALQKAEVGLNEVLKKQEAQELDNQKAKTDALKEQQSAMQQLAASMDAFVKTISGKIETNADTTKIEKDFKKLFGPKTVEVDLKLKEGSSEKISKQVAQDVTKGTDLGLVNVGKDGGHREPEPTLAELTQIKEIEAKDDVTIQPGVSSGHIGTYIPGEMSAEGGAIAQSRRLFSGGKSEEDASKADDEYEAALLAVQEASENMVKSQDALDKQISYITKEPPPLELEKLMEDSPLFDKLFSENALSGGSLSALDDIAESIEETISQLDDSVSYDDVSKAFESEYGDPGATQQTIERGFKSLDESLSSMVESIEISGRKRIASDINMNVVVQDVNATTTSFVRL